MAGREFEVKNRLAACIYAADMDLQHREMVLWDMLSPSKQNWYVKQAAKVLMYAAARTTPPKRDRAAKV